MQRRIVWIAEFWTRLGKLLQTTFISFHLATSQIFSLAHVLSIDRPPLLQLRYILFQFAISLHHSRPILDCKETRISSVPLNIARLIRGFTCQKQIIDIAFDVRDGPD